MLASLLHWRHASAGAFIFKDVVQPFGTFQERFSEREILAGAIISLEKAAPWQKMKRSLKALEY